MLSFERLESRNLLNASVVIAIANVETVQITDADVVEILTPPVSGELSLDQLNNQLDYVWNSSGSDTFRYSPDGSIEVVDVQLDASVNLLIAVDDLYEIQPNAQVKVKAVDGVLANDIIPDNDILDDLIVDILPTHGRLRIDDDGSFSYKPDRHYIGEDSFSYTISSVSDQSSSANVSLIIGNMSHAYDQYFAGIVQQMNQIETAKKKANTNTLPLYIDYYGWQV